MEIIFDKTVFLLNRSGWGCDSQNVAVITKTVFAVLSF